MFSKFLKNKKKEQQSKELKISNEFISEYEVLCKKHNRQLFPVASTIQSGDTLSVKLSLTTTKVVKDDMPILSKRKL